MPISDKYRYRYAYHFTSIENLESIIDQGLLSTNSKIARGITHVNLAEEGIQHRRALMQVPGSGGRCVHDYVPFYFAKKTPMQLAVLHKKNVDQQLVIYLSIPISILDNRPLTYFTDASANTDIPPNFYPAHQSASLDALHWNLIDSARWKYSDIERNRKMAELLVPDQVLINEIDRIITWNKSFSDIVRQIFQGKGVAPPSIIESGEHYYTEPGNWTSSLITGPIFLKKNFEDTVTAINLAHRPNPKFATLDAALDAIRQNFTAIRELEDIDGLGADYGPHKEDVGSHSRRVAGLVRGSPEFQQLNDHNRALLEVAAYLHDIGKGPKSRWTNSFMDKPDSNHASKSLGMLNRILIEDLPWMPPDSVRKLVMLVTYDDLLGDIAANGRGKNQLFDIITSSEDIQMLVALSKADIGSLNQYWLLQTTDKIDQLRMEVLQRLQGVVV